MLIGWADIGDSTDRGLRMAGERESAAQWLDEGLLRCVKSTGIVSRA